MTSLKCHMTCMSEYSIVITIIIILLVIFGGHSKVLKMAPKLMFVL